MSIGWGKKRKKTGFEVRVGDRPVQGKEVQQLKRGRKTDGDLKMKIKDHILESGKTPSYRTAAATFQIPLSTARLYIKNHIGFQRKMRPAIPYHLTEVQKKSESMLLQNHDEDTGNFTRGRI